MSLIVQDDSGTVPGANGYLPLQEFKDYHDARGTGYAGKTDEELEEAIIRATDYVDMRFNFVGRKRNGRSQATEWPRIGAFDRDRYHVQGIPDEIKEAVAEYALRALDATLNPDPDRDSSGAILQSKSETVGPISESVTYVASAVFSMPRYPAADQRLIRSGLVRTAGTVLRS